MEQPGTTGSADRADPDGTPGTGASNPLRQPGGEFRSPLLEAEFAAEHAIENHRHARTLLIASAILNTMFFASDWRFEGTPHFWVAMPARAIVVASALLGLTGLHAWPSALGRQRVMVGWMAVNGAAVAALTSSHSDIALLVVIMLPVIYYLAVPVPFAWTLAAGIGASIVLLGAYEQGRDNPGTSLGSALAMLILNVAMTIVTSRWNRLQRLGWLATRSARQTSAELATSREQIEKMFAASPVPMIVTTRTDGSIVRINDSAVDFFGADPLELGAISVAGMYVDPEARARLLELIDRDHAVRDFEMRVRRADQTIRTVLITANLIDLAEAPVIMAGIIDISDRKAVEKELERIAATDALTGLPNRLSFFTSGRTEMMRATRLGVPLALLMIDLDHFKLVNDNFGHRCGDEALRHFAATCRDVLGSLGITGRLGGEEFSVLLPDTDLPGALRVAEQLRSAVERQPVRTGRKTIRLTASIGVAVIDPRDRDLDRALARADAALYAAKNGGRNRVVAAGAPTVRRAG